MKQYSGISANAGIAIGPAYHFNRTLIVAEDRMLELAEIGEQVSAFDFALEKSKEEIDRISKIAEQKAGTHGSAIFEAQMMMLGDAFILDSIRHRIRAEQKTAAYVVDSEFSHHQHFLQTSENALLRERADDVEDIKQRLLRHLLKKEKLLSKLDHPAIVVASLLTPADAILFSRQELLGFAMDAGGATSHVSILARSMGLPAIVSLRSAASHIETGDILILDADRGDIIVNPDYDTLIHYKDIIDRKEGKQRSVSLEVDGIRRPATLDGRNIVVNMNMELIGDESIAEAEKISKVKGKSIRGLGLLRTEHFLTADDEIPPEEEQTRIYTDLAQRFHPAPITIRTFDIGGDKFIGGGFHEKNPFLGWRGIRISLDEPDAFKAQLRSILRASANHNVKLLLPMIASIDEFDRSMTLLEEAKAELSVLKEKFDPKLPVGVMIEVPAAALLAPLFAERCDYLSIGSNDLTQYTLAVDRGNEFISHMFDELHPAVLRLIAMTVKAAHVKKIPVSLCGEMGAKNIALPLVIGLGMDEISVSPIRVARSAHLIRKLDHVKTKSLVRKVLTEARTVSDVKQMVYRFLKRNDLVEDFLTEQEIEALSGSNVS